MPAFYDRLAAVNKRLLGIYGRSITLRRTMQTYDPITGATTNTTADLVTNGAAKSYRSGLVDGTRIKTGDKELTLTDQQAPQISDAVMVGGEPWTIVHIETIKPADVVIGFRVQVRK